MLSEPAARHAQPEPELELDFAFGGMRIKGDQIDYGLLGRERKRFPLSQAAPGASRASRHVGHARLAELRAQHGLGILDELCWEKPLLDRIWVFSVMQQMI